MLGPYELSGLTLAFLLTGLIVFRSRRITLSGTLPWVGLRNEIFAQFRGHLRDETLAIQTIFEGYLKYGKRDQAFLVPSIDGEPHVVLPQQQVSWMARQPNGSLDANQASEEFLQIRHLTRYQSTVDNPFHRDILRRHSTQQLGNLTSDIVEELTHSITKQWGDDCQNWTDVCAFETLLVVVQTLSSRALVGLPLTRNERYTKCQLSFTVSAATQGFLIRKIPFGFLRPVLGPLLGLPTKYWEWRCARFLVPLIWTRLEINLRGKSSNVGLPSDLVQWVLNAVMTRPSLAPLDMRHIASRIMHINFAAVLTSTETITHALFNLLSSPHYEHFTHGIREETAAVLAAHDGQWTKDSVSKLYRADSTIRETLRYTGLQGMTMVRYVASDGGITLPDGLHLPEGTKIGVPAAAIHRDERFYPNPDEFDAFRFVGAQHSLPNASGKQQGSSAAGAEPYRQVSAASTSETFLPFSHGRSACPGRFFAAHQLKIMLAYIMLNYDIKPLASRPPNEYFSDNITPSATATISVRRRRPGS